MPARATRSRATTKAKSASDSVKRGTRQGNGKGSKYFDGKRKAGKRAELDEDENVDADEDGDEDLQDEGEGEVGEDGDGDATESESEAESLHSDALDDEDEEEEQVGGKGRKGAKTGVKRKRASGPARPRPAVRQDTPAELVAKKLVSHLMFSPVYTTPGGGRGGHGLTARHSTTGGTRCARRRRRRPPSSSGSS